MTPHETMTVGRSVWLLILSVCRNFLKGGRGEFHFHAPVGALVLLSLLILRPYRGGKPRKQRAKVKRRQAYYNKSYINVSWSL